MKERHWMIVTLLAALALTACTTPTPVTEVVPTEMENLTVTPGPEVVEMEPFSDAETTKNWMILFSACLCETEVGNNCEEEHCLAHIYSADLNGQNLQRVIEGKYSATDPRPSPDGRFIAFEDFREEPSNQSEGNGHGRVVYPRVYIFDTLRPDLLPTEIRSASSAQWSSEGERLIYLKNHNLYTTDIKEGVTIQLTNFTESLVYDYALLPDNNGVLFLHQELPNTQIQAVHLARNTLHASKPITLVTLFVEASYSHLKLSPDGNQLFIITAFSSTTPTRDLVLVQTTTGETSHLFHSDLSIQVAEWLTDSQSILIVEADLKNSISIFSKIAVTNGEKEELFRVEGISGNLFGILSPDRKCLILSEFSLSETGKGIYVIDIPQGTWKQIFQNYQVTLSGISVYKVPPNQEMSE